MEDHISVKPTNFDMDLNKAVEESIKAKYSERIDEEIGIVISFLGIEEIGQGFKLPENPDRHYPVKFKILCYKPEVHEVFEGEVTSVTNFGVFVNLGLIEGLAHLTQTMNDYVTFSKTGVLQGKETRRTLKQGDKVRAKVVAVSFKDPKNVKVGLTMRQPGLGALEWLEEEVNKQNGQ